MKHPNEFVGINWVQGGHSTKGADCWGLTILVLNQCYGIKIKEFIGAKYEGDALSTIIQQGLKKDSYRLIDVPTKGSICIMYSKITKRPEHVGVFIGELKVIHSPGGVLIGTSRIDNIQTLKRLYYKIEFYNHE